MYNPNIINQNSTEGIYYGSEKHQEDRAGLFLVCQNPVQWRNRIFFIKGRIHQIDMG